MSAKLSVAILATGLISAGLPASAQTWTRADVWYESDHVCQDEGPSAFSDCSGLLARYVNFQGIYTYSGSASADLEKGAIRTNAAVTYTPTDSQWPWSLETHARASFRDAIYGTCDFPCDPTGLTRISLDAVGFLSNSLANADLKLEIYTGPLSFGRPISYNSYTVAASAPHSSICGSSTGGVSICGSSSNQGAGNWSFELDAYVPTDLLLTDGIWIEGTLRSFAGVSSEPDYYSLFSSSDWSHTALLSIETPEGVSWRSASGVLLTELTTPVPEPETYAMLLAGLGLLGFYSRRRKSKQNASL